MVSAQGLIRLGFKADVDFVTQDDGDGIYIREWKSNLPQPSDAEIEAAHNEGEAEYVAQEYARQRKAEYPSIDELIVALWEGVVEERMAAVTALEVSRQAVKDKYPKV